MPKATVTAVLLEDRVPNIRVERPPRRTVLLRLLVDLHRGAKVLLRAEAAAAVQAEGSNVPHLSIRRLLLLVPRLLPRGPSATRALELSLQTLRVEAVLFKK